ncbi:phenazine biosynthesis protein PhzA, partial [Pseudomonas aeruginosa]
MREYQRLKGFTDNLELRRRNRATVEHYMRMKGAERLQRHSLFVEDGCAGNWTTESGEPLVFRGHESLRRLAEWLERCFPDWEWHNVRIFETEDPNHFWVECDGRGKAL